MTVAELIRNRLGKSRLRNDAAGGPDTGRPIDQCRYVVIDTELTGLDIRKDSIVSIGAVAMSGGRILLGENFYRMVKPATELSSASVVIHGIMPSDVAGKPAIAEVFHDFLKFCEGSVVVGHFLGLDLAFLNKELRRADAGMLANPTLDTLRVHEWMEAHKGDFSRHYFCADENRDLFTIAKKYNINVAGAHNALMDAFVTAQLLQRFLTLLPGSGVRTVKDLLRIGKP